MQKHCIFFKASKLNVFLAMAAISETERIILLLKLQYSSIGLISSIKLFFRTLWVKTMACKKNGFGGNTVYEMNLFSYKTVIIPICPSSG